MDVKERERERLQKHLQYCHRHHHHHQRIPNIDIECVNVPRQKVFPLFGAQLRYVSIVFSRILIFVLGDQLNLSPVIWFLLIVSWLTYSRIPIIKDSFDFIFRFLFNFGFDDYIVTDLNCLEHYTNIIFYHLDTIPFCNRIFAQRKSSKSIQAGLHKIIFCRTDSSTVNPSVR